VFPEGSPHKQVLHDLVLLEPELRPGLPRHRLRNHVRRHRLHGALCHRRGSAATAGGLRGARAPAPLPRSPGSLLAPPLVLLDPQAELADEGVHLQEVGGWQVRPAVTLLQGSYWEANGGISPLTAVQLLRWGPILCEDQRQEQSALLELHGVTLPFPFGGPAASLGACRSRPLHPYLPSKTAGLRKCCSRWPKERQEYMQPNWTIFIENQSQVRSTVSADCTPSYQNQPLFH